MTIKLLLLKSGEDIIADVTEMAVGEEEERSIVGYFLDKPCVIRMRDPNLIEEQGPKKQSGFQVSLFPWIPLSKETRIPVPSDWLITMVEPAYKLKEMYVKDIVKNGNQSNSTDDNAANTDKSD
tara:strand:+ start:16 stop:387 length:372 start_codon:yes stop_codon:yes gene_type:complete